LVIYDIEKKLFLAEAEVEAEAEASHHQKVSTLKYQFAFILKI